jgi:hypothetical protein
MLINLHFVCVCLFICLVIPIHIAYVVYELQYDRRMRSPQSPYYGRYWPVSPVLVSSIKEGCEISAARWSRAGTWLTFDTHHLLSIDQDGNILPNP